MKSNMFKVSKNTIVFFILIISIIMFSACSINKSIVLENDVKKSSKSFQGNIKVSEKFIHITENEDGRWFVPSFWENDKLFGTLLYYKSKKGEKYIKKYMSDYFHALDVNKEVLEKTTKKPFFPYQRLNQIIEIPLTSGNIYYYDFSNKKSKKNFLGKFNDLNNSGFTQCRIVEGNEKFGAIYQYKEDKNIESIKLIDLTSRRVYKNDNISDIEIIKVVYIKDFKKFMAIDKKGTCYEIMFKGNSLNLKKYSQIDTGDLTLEQSYNGVLGICDDSEIYFISRNEIGKNKLIKNRLIKYDFKTKKTDFILNINENDKTRALEYFPKQNILILEKPNMFKKDGTKKECSDIYLAEIKNNKVNIFYKSKYKNEENKYSKTLIEKLGCKTKDKNYIKDNDDDMRIRINNKGDRLAITRNIDIFHKNINKNIKRQVVDYYYIKRD